MPSPFTTLFVDVGGVLLTHAWSPIERLRAVEHFALDREALEQRHHLAYALYEEGKLSLEEYLELAVFHEGRSFTRQDFQAFIFSQFNAWPQMIELVCKLRARHGLKVVAVGNEGWEMAVHRIEKFSLKTIVDFFVLSCFVHRRKPDPAIYQIALDIAQAPPEAVLCIEDQPMFAEAAKNLGMHAFQHLSYKFTRTWLAEEGLSVR